MMRLRKQELGTRNLVGARVEAARKKKGMKQKELLAQLQVNGVDMNASGLSKLEGQIRFVTDVELVALADILEVSVDFLLGRAEGIKYIFIPYAYCASFRGCVFIMPAIKAAASSILPVSIPEKPSLKLYASCSPSAIILIPLCASFS